MGGFGNQLFQYSLYDHLNDINHNALLDYSYYVLSNSVFEEMKAVIPLDNKTLIDLSRKPVYWLNFKYSMIKHFYSFLTNIYYIEKIFNQQYNINQIRKIINKNIYRNLTIEGYFQGTNFISDSLRANILSRGKSSLVDPVNLKLISVIDSFSNSVSLHVRRGDYLNGDQLRVMSLDYYIEAIEIVKSLKNRIKVFIFSDDISWCKVNFGMSPDYVFVEVNSGSLSYKDLFLMASCKDNIISASTFSWWAAYLNNNPNKIVVAPKFWYSSKYRYKENFDLRVSGWIYL